MRGVAARRRRHAGPMSAAGLISFYDEYEGKIKLSPTALTMIALLFTIMVILARALG